MTREAKIMPGVILLTIPTIQYGGYFLLTSLKDPNSHYMDNALRQNFFRAGHAHAGVFVILALVCARFSLTMPHCPRRDYGLPVSVCPWLQFSSRHDSS